VEEQKKMEAKKIIYYMASLLFGILLSIASFAANDIYGRIREVENKVNSFDVIQSQLENIQCDIDDIKDDVKAIRE